MNVEFKRDLNHNYIKIDSEEEFFEYQVQMIMRNSIEGLLTCTKESVNNKTSFLYEINSRQPFVQVFQRNKMNFQMFRNFIGSIRNVVDVMADYMLDVNSLILMPEYMYMNPETKEVGFIYLPGAWNEIKEEFHELSRQLLDWIDYKDEQLVSSAYELYRMTGEENYTLSEIFDTIFTSVSKIPSKESIVESAVIDNRLDDNVPAENNYNELEEDFVYEEDYEEILEKESVLKKITRPIIEATGNFIKSFTSKTKEEKSFDYDGIQDYEFEFSENRAIDIREDVNKINESVHRFSDNGRKPSVNYNQYSKGNISPAMVAEADGGYGDTVFFQEADTGNVRLIPVDTDRFEEFELDIFPYIIGKLSDAVDGVIKDESVSRIHSKIERQDLEYFVVDLNSTNGTYVNGKLVSPNEKAKLQSGDRIQFGLVEYKFKS